MAKKLSQINPFGLRIPEDLKEKLDFAAKAHKPTKRSLNSEMLARLEDSFGSRADISSIPDSDLIAELLRRYERGVIKIQFSSPEFDDITATDSHTKK